MATLEKKRMIGERKARLDGPDKVTGRFEYGFDLVRAGMLHVKVFRSTHAHAHIRRLDTSKAAALPGVRVIMTAADLPSHIRYGHTLRDEVVFASDRVLYVGQPIAALAADTVEIAEQALRLIEIDYEDLPVLQDPEESLKPDAPRLHPDLASYKGNPDLVRYGNVCGHTTLQRGDVEAGFAEADYVFEDTFQTHMVHQGYLEYRSGVAWVEADGTVVVNASTQNPFNIASQLSQVLELPLSRIRVISSGVGGGFGGKLDMGVEHIIAVLARKCGRPVKYTWTRDEEMKAAHPRQAAKLWVKTGVNKDGTLVARQARFLFNAGAFGGDSTVICAVAVMLVRGPYRIPHVQADSLAVYTNRTNCGAYRGPSGPQVYFAMESQLDKIAKTLGIDPVEIRRKNMVSEGDLGPTNQVLEAVGARDTLEKAAAAIEWDKPRPKWRGKGLASAWWTTTTGSSSAYVKVNEDASVDLITGGKEIGSGAMTMGVVQILAEEMGMDPTEIRIISGDTAATPYDFGAQGSRTTYNVGNAALLAARDVKKQIFEAAAVKLGVRPEDLDLQDKRVIVKGDAGKFLDLAELATARIWEGGPFIGRGSFMAPPTEYDPATLKGGLYPAFNSPSFHTHAAEVEVDPGTGEVTVLRYIVAQDVGKAINPTGVEGQMIGGAVQGIGYALSEELMYDKNGQVLNPNLTDYKMPTIMDVPRLETIIVEHPTKVGPHGAKGVGEPPIVLPAATLANAVYDAIGVQIKDLPITAEKVLRAIRSKQEG